MRHIVRGMGLAAAMAMPALGQTVPPERPATERAETSEHTLVAQSSRTSRLIFEIQRGLRSLGYRTGRPDGVYGPATRRAIQAFQRDNGMRVTGNISSALYERVRARQGVRSRPRTYARSTPRRRIPRSDFSRPGFFIGAAGTMQISQFTGDLQEIASTPPFSLTADVENSFGASIRAGYRFNDWIAADIDFEYISGFSILFDGVEFFELGGYVGTVNVMFIAPLGRVEPYARLGVGGTVFDFRNVTGIGLDFESSDVAVTGRLGGGVQVHVTRNIAVMAEVSYNLNSILLTESLSSSSLSMANYLTIQVGGIFRF